jgi:hypothetical protein
MYWQSSRWFEVIGNVFENGDLLSVVKSSVSTIKEKEEKKSEDLNEDLGWEEL